MSEAQVLKIVEAIYQAGTMQDGWRNVLNDLADLAGAELASLAVASPQEGLFSITSPRTDQDFTSRFGDDWLAKDITAPTTMMAEVGKIITLKDTGRDAFLSSEFYNDFWKKTGHGAERIRVNLVKSSKTQVNFGLSPYRTSDEISTDMIKTSRIFIPHLVQAAGIQIRMRQLQLETTLSNATNKSGTLVVNRDGLILIADPKAEEILSGRSALLARKGHIVARCVSDTSTIHRLIASCAPNSRGVQLRGGILKAQYSNYSTINVSILPIDETFDGFALDAGPNANPIALIALEDPVDERRNFCERLHDRYGLTPAETRVALELLEGDGRSAVAQRLNLSESTVRTHMSRIFEKTEVQRQAQLIRLLLRAFHSG